MLLAIDEALVVADWLQTKRLVAAGRREGNVFLGPHPSQERINILLPVGMAVGAGLACRFTPELNRRRDFLLIWMAIEGLAVNSNAHKGFEVRARIHW